MAIRTRTFVPAIVLMLLLSHHAGLCSQPPKAKDSDIAKLPAKIAPFFRPPPEFAEDYGDYRPVLKFDDGSPVKTPADWQKRRAEIMQTWRRLIGSWPPLIDKPKLEYLAKEQREDFTQHQVRVEIAPNQQTVMGYLLVPDGRGPFPAVLVVYYDAETAAGLARQADGGQGKELRDFALQLARRGFVTLSIGTPDFCSLRPPYKPLYEFTKGETQLQPLSALAYVAANCYNCLANRPEVDPARIGIVGHSYGGKWAMFASGLYEKFACAVWSDPGIVFDETRPNVNYWEPWYLGYEPDKQRQRGVPSESNPRTGPYKSLLEQGHDLHELHALMAPRPFLVSGGSEDPPQRWKALNHTIAVNKLLGYSDRVAMTNRRGHTPTPESNEQIYLFFEHFLKHTSFATTATTIEGRHIARANVPVDNPVSRYNLSWTGDIKWSNVVSIEDFAGNSPQAKIQAAQNAVAAQGGGVVYFPPGLYRFTDNITLKSGVVIRGHSPQDVTDARHKDYQLLSRFEFPRYVPSFEGHGTPKDSAFKGIHLADHAGASNCGVVNICINHGHIYFGQGENYQAGRNRLVYGCILRNAALIDANVPDASIGQHPWQRFTKWHQAAIQIYSAENALVANNRLPESDGNFLQKGYVLQGRGKDKPKVIVEEGVWFDHDNRPGISVNLYAIGGTGGRDPKGTPQTHPHGFRKGLVIRDNYIYSTGRSAIGFAGDGTICAFNVIRFKPDVLRWTNTGRGLVAGSSTNDNRAILARGWRWTIEGNDYETYRNRAGRSGYYINDGEGIMHEGHANSVIRDSKLINNKGNAYISMYLTAGIDGLLIAGNDIRPQGPGTDTRIATIFVNANRNYDKHYCRNVRIIDNVTFGSGILIAGEPAENNLIKGNRHIGPQGTIRNQASAVVEDNVGYEVVVEEP